jgi:serine protease Do
VVGINTAIVGATGNIGIGFAIPINMAKHAYEQLLAGGEIERGFLGIQFKEVTPDLAASIGLDRDTKGVMVDDVVPDSAAEKAGLKTYDVIIELNGEPVEKGNEFLNRVALMNPGAKVDMIVIRDGKRREFNVTLGKRPSQEELAGGLPSETQEELGFAVANLTDDLASRLGYEGEYGVVVVRVDSGSAAARVGLAPRMLIKEVNRQRIRNKKEFNEAIAEAKKRGVALLLVQQGDDTSTLLIELSD